MQDEDVARRVAQLLQGRQIGTAESCTAGRVAEVLACVEEASDFLRGGLVAYQDAIKRQLLGVTAESVDAAARQILEEAGLGDYFVHRTGHGIGLDVHEDPYIVAGNTRVLEPGMAFSVEPGFYVPGRYGARIEDIVVVTDDGAERLNQRPRELAILQAP